MPRKHSPRHLAKTAILWALLPIAALGSEEAGNFDFQEIVLQNGLRVISVEDFSCPIVAVHLWYHVGSKDEDPQRQGFAHMFEHMMFRGTDRLGSTDHFDFIRKTGGTCNAYTTFDQTVYTQSLPANQLNLALWLEAERMSMLKIDQTAFDTERKVVEEERRMGVNRPYGKLMEKALPHLFADHPYRWSTIGSIPHLRSASVPELREFWTQYYVPNNATLIVVGAVKHAEVQQLAKRNFGWIPRCDDPPRIPQPTWQPFEAGEVTIKEKNAPAPLIGLIFRGVPLNHPDSTAIDLFTMILGGGESSRIYRRMVAEEESAVMAMSASMSLEQNGIVAAGAVLPPFGGEMNKAIDSLKDEIRTIQNELVSDEELLKARNQMLRDLVTESLTVESKAAALGSAAVLEGDVARINSRLDRIRDVTAEDIQRVANQYMDLDHCIVGRIHRNLLGALGNLLGMRDDVERAPITGATESDPPAPGRPGVARPATRLAASPIAGPLTYDANPAYSELTLDNGLRLVVVENHEVPYISVRLGLEAGAWTETKPGAASLALGMLTKGTAEHSEKELSEELESYAINLSGSATLDTATVSMGCLPEQIERGLRLMSEVVLHPTMPEDEFKRLKKQTRTGLVISAKSPAYIADREMRRRLFGDHPYARSAEGEVADLNRLELADVQQWWQSFARPDMATLIFAGDIDLAEAGTLAKKHFVGWQKTGTRPAIESPPLPTPGDLHIYLVDNAGVQSQIRVGHLAFNRLDPAYFTSRVLSGYFGGAFNSRLNETIRVEKGLTYGARGGFSAQRQTGRFVVSTFSKNATTVEAVQSILDEIERLRQDAPTEKELNNTISFILGSYPSDRETPQQVAQDVWFVQSMGLPADYYKQMLDHVADTTAESCLALAQQHVHPQQLTIVVVGPARKLQAKLEEIAPVTVVKSD